MKNTIKIKQFSLSHFVWVNLLREPLLEAVQLSRLFSKPTASLTDYKSQIVQSDLLTCKDKPLHGQFSVQIKAITTV